MTILNFLFGPPESQTVKKNLKKNVAILMENQNLQQSLLDTNAKAVNITKIYLVKNRHVISGLVNALKIIHTTMFHSSLTNQRLNYAHNFFLILAGIDHILSQLCNGLRKLESDMFTIYSYLNTLSTKIVTPTLIDPTDLKIILNNIQTVVPSYLSLPSDPSTNTWSFYKFLKIQPLVYILHFTSQ